MALKAVPLATVHPHSKVVTAANTLLLRADHHQASTVSRVDTANRAAMVNKVAMADSRADMADSRVDILRKLRATEMLLPHLLATKS